VAFLDHASSSPLRPSVVDALTELLALPQSDPGRPYDDAITIRRIIEESRDAVAALGHVTPRQVVFTSSIAESIATSLSAFRGQGSVATSQTERASVLEEVAHHGQLITIPVDALGHYDLDTLTSLLADQAIDMISVHAANHETGTLQDIQAVVGIARAHKVAIHIDASMVFGHVDMDFGDLDADVVSVTGELLGAPQGVAALFVRKGHVLAPLLRGGTQERARRAGLENILGIVGMGVAASSLSEPGVLAQEAGRARLQIAALENAALGVDGVEAVGDPNPEQRVSYLRCFTIAGVEAEPVLMGLNRVGVAVHSGSACASESFEPSPVLAAMGLEADRSMRVSVGWSTTDRDVQRFVDHIGPVIRDLRALGHEA
jgi:cysteine desulfurase